MARHSLGSAEAAAYFRTRPELDRALREMAAKFLSYGRAAGQVPLLSAQEARAIEGISCAIRTSKGSPVVDLAELDQALRERTRFACGLQDALEAYLGQRLESRKSMAERESQAWEAFFRQLVIQASAVHKAEPGWIADWLHADSAYVRKQWKAGAGGLCTDVICVHRALALLPERGTILDLPVLAQRAAGNAHALDANTRAGRLFERALRFAYPESGGSAALSAADRDELLALAGLSVDEISSTVLVAGLGGATPFLQAVRQSGHSLALTLRTIRSESAQARAFRDTAFVVENPSVFSALHRAQVRVNPATRATLICTSGHLSLAAIRLLESLGSQGTKLHYAGDFDANGLRIAYGLQRKLGDALEMWRMTPADYQKARARSEAAGDFEIASPEVTQAFGSLASAISNGGSVHQEALIPEYLADLAA